jgi:hypothetical protein
VLVSADQQERARHLGNHRARNLEHQLGSPDGDAKTAMPSASAPALMPEIGIG